MGKDKRGWRKLVKKLRRSRIRKCKARQDVGFTNDDISDGDNNGGMECDLEVLAEEQRWHDLEEEAWKEREKQSNIAFKLKLEEKEHLAKSLAAEKERIRQKWEEKLRMDAEAKSEADQIAKEKQAKQEEEFNDLLEFLSGDIETPPLTYLMPEIGGDDQDDPCLYFSRTGACRFFGRCRQPHRSPTMSTTILIANFFSHFSLEESMDTNLEYEDAELYKEFLTFHDDVLPELRKFGTVIQFKVCRNFELHLRGNVYIQYETIREAVEVYRKFNGRFYNGKQLSLRFVKIISWRSAICGQFNRGCCVKGKSCNYLHVFRNPTKEFVFADNDWTNREFRLLSKPSRSWERSSSTGASTQKFERDKSTVPSTSECSHKYSQRKSRSRSSTNNSNKRSKKRSRSRSRKSSHISSKRRSSSRSRRSLHKRSKRRSTSAGHNSKSDNNGDITSKNKSSHRTKLDSTEKKSRIRSHKKPKKKHKKKWSRSP